VEGTGQHTDRIKLCIQSTASELENESHFHLGFVNKQNTRFQASKIHTGTRIGSREWEHILLFSRMVHAHIQ